MDINSKSLFTDHDLTSLGTGVLGVCYRPLTEVEPLSDFPSFKVDEIISEIINGTFFLQF